MVATEFRSKMRNFCFNKQEQNGSIGAELRIVYEVV